MPNSRLLCEAAALHADSDVILFDPEGHAADPREPNSKETLRAVRRRGSGELGAEARG